MALDCTKMTTAELTTALRDVNSELDRRALLAAAPKEFAAGTTKYIADGGKRADLVKAVQEAPEPSTTGSGSSSTGGSGSTSGGSGAGTGLAVNLNVGLGGG